MIVIGLTDKVLREKALSRAALGKGVQAPERSVETWHAQRDVRSRGTDPEDGDRNSMRYVKKLSRYLKEIVPFGKSETRKS